MHDQAEQLLEGLDDAQRQAATALQGPVRIIAVAGAGKTRTITRRIAYACATGEWEPGAVLAVTFSVRAAAQMRHRLELLDVGDRVTAATFHAAALHQLRRAWGQVSEGPFPKVMRRPEEVLLRAIRRVVGIDDSDPQQCRDILGEINWAKVSLVAPEDYARVCVETGRQVPAGLDARRFTDVYVAYEQEKSSRGEIDFNDMLLMMCHIMDDCEDVANSIRSRVRWITVDEYQDISPLQHLLMTRWLGTNRNICVVGDPAQTIYSFAGASGYHLLHFADEFSPLSADVSLATDYRSTANIVSRANRVLAASSLRDDYLKLVPARAADAQQSGERGGTGKGNGAHHVGARVTRTVYEDDAQEVRSIAQRIRRLVERGLDPADCAVLTRINAQQKLLCVAMKEAGLRYRVRSESGWANSSVDISTDIDAQDHAAMLEAMGIGRKLHAVTISTIHAAKGMEFGHVFIIGCSEGLLPYGSPSSSDALEEERRLMYVGITRAKESLSLSYARHKDTYSIGVMRQPSRFL